MVSSPASKMMLLFTFSIGVMGSPVPAGSTSNEELSLQGVLTQYSTELEQQKVAVESLERQLLSEQPSADEIEAQADVLLAQYHLIGPRQRLIDLISPDAVLSTEGVEYLATLAGRYAENVAHAARTIKGDPSSKPCSLSTLQYLKAEKQKSEIFDRALLDLANLAHQEAQTDAGNEAAELVLDDQKDESPVEGSENEEEDGAYAVTEYSSETPESEEVTSTYVQKMQVEEEQHTPTGDVTTVTYSETTITWSN